MAVPTVTDVVHRITRRYATAVDRPGGVTLTFDAGQNSEPNFTHLAKLNLHFVGSVPPSDHPALLARPASARTVVDAYADENLTALDTRARVPKTRPRRLLRPIGEPLIWLPPGNPDARGTQVQKR